MQDKLKPFFCGFDLGGWKRDGKIYPHDPCPDSKPLDGWPEEIECYGNVYTLEEIQPGAINPEKGQWENAVYV